MDIDEKTIDFMLRSAASENTSNKRKIAALERKVAAQKRKIDALEEEKQQTLWRSRYHLISDRDQQIGSLVTQLCDERRLVASLNKRNGELREALDMVYGAIATHDHCWG